MNHLLDLNDLIRIKPDHNLTKLSKADKHRFMDSVLQNPESNAKRGLAVKMNISSSMRKINNRIYSSAGQMNHADTWVDPFPIPVIVAHDSDRDPLGRIRSVEYVAHDELAKPFFRSAQEFSDFKRASNSNSAVKIRKLLDKHNLLTNPKWPGLGALEGEAVIYDEDAIEKFLDGRYLTFSAGARTSSLKCGICDSDWALGDVCDHRLGEVVDGELAVFLAGAFIGREVSVVNEPANKMSRVISMQFADSQDKNQLTKDQVRIANEDIYLTDAVFSLDSGENKMTALLQKDFSVEDVIALDGIKLVAELADKDEGYQLAFTDSLSADSHYETSWLIKVHDALHCTYDYELKYRNTEDEPLPPAVFKMHAKLHQLSEEKGFRDSILNGQLDHYDESGGESEAFVLPAVAKLEDTFKEEIVLLIKGTIGDLLETKEIEKVSDEEIKDAKETEEVAETRDDSTECTATLNNADWDIVDLAYRGLAAKEKVSFEDVKCIGPDEKVPCATEEHKGMLKRVLDVVGFNDRKKALVLDKALESTSSDAKFIDLTKRFDLLMDAHQKLLVRLEDKKDEKKSTEELASTEETHVNIATEDKQVPQLEPVVNPSIANADTKKLSKFTDFENKIVQKYHKMIETGDEAEASHYLRVMKNQGYVAKNFDPKLLMES